MIISFKNNFCFLKTRKTAGTAIEIALSRLCGDQDIITPISPDDEKLRQSFGRGAQNYGERYYNHMPLIEAMEGFGECFPKDIYAVERHPYDKVMSMAGYMHTTPDAVLMGLAQLPLNWPIYCSHKGIAMAKVIKYDELEKVENIFQVKLQRVKALHRKDYEMTDEQKEKTQLIFEHEFKLHKWEA